MRIDKYYKPSDTNAEDFKVIRVYWESAGRVEYEDIATGEKEVYEEFWEGEPFEYYYEEATNGDMIRALFGDSFSAKKSWWKEKYKGVGR